MFFKIHFSKKISIGLEKPIFKGKVCGLGEVFFNENSMGF